MHETLLKDAEAYHNHKKVASLKKQNRTYA